MKKLILGVTVFSFLSLSVIGNEPLNANAQTMRSIGNDEGKITLINDSPNAIKVHTGTGEVTLNPRGGKTSFSCDPGKSIKFDGKVAFKVTEEMCGQTIKLSTYL